MQMTPKLEAALIALRDADTAATAAAASTVQHARTKAERMADNACAAACWRRIEAVDALCKIIGSPKLRSAPLGNDRTGALT